MAVAVRAHDWEYAPQFRYYRGADHLENRWLCLQCGKRLWNRSQRAPWCQPSPERAFLPTYDALAADVAAYRVMLAEFA